MFASDTNTLDPKVGLIGTIEKLPYPKAIGVRHDQKRRFVGLNGTYDDRRMAFPSTKRTSDSWGGRFLAGWRLSQSEFICSQLG